MANIEQLPLPGIRRGKGRPYGSKTRPLDVRLAEAERKEREKKAREERLTGRLRPVFGLDDQITAHLRKRIGTMRAVAHTRGFRFDVTVEDMATKFKAQDARCAYSGIELLITHASLDRISSFQGYVPGNIQWVMPFVNCMKNDATHEEFLELIRAIYDHSIRDAP